MVIPGIELERFSHELKHNLPVSQELFIYLASAWRYLRGAREPITFRTPLWDFCRFARRHPDLLDVSSEDAVQLLQTFVERMVRDGYVKPGVPWQVCFPGVESEEDARMEVFSNWEMIRWVPGQTPLQNALLKATQFPLTPPNCPTKIYKLFISLAYWLQMMVGPGRTILLPCHEMGDLLGVTAMTISRCRKMAVERRYLSKVKNHSFNPVRESGTATEFRFNFKKATECNRDWLPDLMRLESMKEDQ